MKTYTILVERVQFGTYYIEANNELEARCKAKDQAQNDDWSVDKAYYLTEIVPSDLPF